ncbi:hypothetical protein ACN47E_000311 [Coniothyrium glycines]
MTSLEGGGQNGQAASHHDRGRTSVQGTRFATAHQSSNHQVVAPGAANTVYIVVDTCYPRKDDFDQGKGVTNVFSVHSSMDSANAKAKKIIFTNEGSCTVDVDKVIEETRLGLYTGIGIGGQEEAVNHCYARKCEVEAKIVDEDSEDESGDSMESTLLDKDNEVEMG